MERLCRFGDIDLENSGIDVGEICKTSRNFFISQDVDKRMNEMRAAILYVRKNWHDKEIKENAVKSFEKNHKIKLMDKNWCDTPEFKKENSNYELVKYYTTDEGYNDFFGRMNGNIRNLDSTNIEKELGSYKEITETAFLIEYMNIELYNFIHEHKDFANFEGCVYRGMKVPKEVIDDFSHIKELPVSERKMSVPMSFMSTSKDKEIAMNFLRSYRRKESCIGERENLIMKIHVANLSQELLSFYHRFFPDSVVSSLCAVPIKAISCREDENEVLLRGAFFQILDFYKEKSQFEFEKSAYVIELLMMNSNRDHITTSQFEKTNAREIFNTLVLIDKFKKSRDFVSDQEEQSLYFDEERKGWARLLELERIENGRR